MVDLGDQLAGEYFAHNENVWLAYVGEVSLNNTVPRLFVQIHRYSSLHSLETFLGEKECKILTQLSSLQN